MHHEAGGFTLLLVAKHCPLERGVNPRLPSWPPATEIVQHIGRNSQLHRLLGLFAHRRASAADKLLPSVHIGRPEKPPRQLRRVIRIDPFLLSRAFVLSHEHTSSI